MSPKRVLGIGGVPRRARPNPRGCGCWRVAAGVLLPPAAQERAEGEGAEPCVQQQAMILGAQPTASTEQKRKSAGECRANIQAVTSGAARMAVESRAITPGSARAQVTRLRVWRRVAQQGGHNGPPMAVEELTKVVVALISAGYRTAMAYA
eukprot:5406603-Amphidinium_carterae.1